MVLFAFYLAAMSYVPEPTPRPNPEAVLALNLGARKQFLSEKGEKRSSMSSLSSASSMYSQKSYISRIPPGPNARHTPRPTPIENGRITPYTYNSPTTPQYPARAARSPSIATVPRTPYAQYPQSRPGTPGSVRSMAPSTVSNIRASTRQRYYISNRIPAPQPRAPEQLQVPPLAQQKFFDPVSRQGTPMSMASNRSQYAMQQVQRHPQGYLSPPPGLGSVGNGLNFPQPPGYARGPQYPPRVTSPLASSHGRLSPVHSEPDHRDIGAQMRQAMMMRTPSPGIHSLNSPTSPDDVRGRASRSNSVSTVPRSPSPQSASYSNLSTVLPGHPLLPSPGKDRPEMDDARRYGPSPDIRLNNRPIPGGNYYTEGEYPVRTANNWVTSGNDKMGAVDYWRQH